MDIADVKRMSVGERIQCIFPISEIDKMGKTKEGTYKLKVKLTDGKDRLSIILFSKDQSKLPCIDDKGRNLSVSDTVISEFNGNKYLFGGLFKILPTEGIQNVPKKPDESVDTKVKTPQTKTEQPATDWNAKEMRELRAKHWNSALMTIYPEQAKFNTDRKEIVSIVDAFAEAGFNFTYQKEKEIEFPDKPKEEKVSS